MTVREREFEIFRDKLLDVRTLDEVGIGDFDDFKDLIQVLANFFSLCGPRIVSRPAIAVV